LKTNEPNRYAQPQAVEYKLEQLRVTATGEKRKRGYAKGRPRPATYGSGQRVQHVRSLSQVCERTALPPPKSLTSLPLVEHRMLEQSGTLGFVREIQHEKLKIQKVKKEGTRNELLKFVKRMARPEPREIGQNRVFCAFDSVSFFIRNSIASLNIAHLTRS
jgi:hypothetical protein